LRLANFYKIFGDLELKETKFIPYCRRLVSDSTPRVTLAVLLGRMVLLTAAQWFVLGAREIETGDFL
jgi:hypothetical protein